jgi:hypothetical protein
VGQWTGLTDKNGVKIFEGDFVLRRSTGNSGIESVQKFLIVFEKGCFQLKRLDSCFCGGLAPNGFSLYEDYAELEAYTREYPQVKGRYEIIGNIHDNPEFLPDNANKKITAAFCTVEYCNLCEKTTNHTDGVCVPCRNWINTMIGQGQLDKISAAGYEVDYKNPYKKTELAEDGYNVTYNLIKSP